MTRNLRNRKGNPEDLVMSALAERLREAAENRDVGELATKVGVTPVTFYRWMSAKFDPGVAKLSELAEALNVSLAWLITGQAPMGRRQAIRHARLADYGAPEYVAPQSSSDQSPIAFREPWLFGFLYGHGDSNTIVLGDMLPPLLLNVPDDSMEPTIRRGALVLIDRSFGMTKETPADAGSIYDGIYLVVPTPPSERSESVPTRYLLRRLLYRLDGNMIVRCDNPKYSDEIYTPKTRNWPKRIGRAVWLADRI
ncbi:MAG: helix-turn-helix domain-containing protein [Candidatus Binataceae bacterium]|jgi:phage repressor protein C with HTH and peptisase S24 domain